MSSWFSSGQYARDSDRENAKEAKRGEELERQGTAHLEGMKKKHQSKRHARKGRSAAAGDQPSRGRGDNDDDDDGFASAEEDQPQTLASILQDAPPERVTLRRSVSSIQVIPFLFLELAHLTQNGDSSFPVLLNLNWMDNRKSGEILVVSQWVHYLLQQVKKHTHSTGDTIRVVASDLSTDSTNHKEYLTQQLYVLYVPDATTHADMKVVIHELDRLGEEGGDTEFKVTRILLDSLLHLFGRDTPLVDVVEEEDEQVQATSSSEEHTRTTDRYDARRVQRRAAQQTSAVQNRRARLTQLTRSEARGVVVQPFGAVHQLTLATGGELASGSGRGASFSPIMPGAELEGELLNMEPAALKATHLLSFATLIYWRCVRLFRALEDMDRGVSGHSQGTEQLVSRRYARDAVRTSLGTRGRQARGGEARASTVVAAEGTAYELNRNAFEVMRRDVARLQDAILFNVRPEFQPAFQLATYMLAVGEPDAATAQTDIMSSGALQVDLTLCETVELTTNSHANLGDIWRQRWQKAVHVMPELGNIFTLITGDGHPVIASGRDMLARMVATRGLQDFVEVSNEFATARQQTAAKTRVVRQRQEWARWLQRVGQFVLDRQGRKRTLGSGKSSSSQQGSVHRRKRV